MCVDLSPSFCYAGYGTTTICVCWGRNGLFLSSEKVYYIFFVFVEFGLKCVEELNQILKIVYIRFM